MPKYVTMPIPAADLQKAFDAQHDAEKDLPPEARWRLHTVAFESAHDGLSALARIVWEVPLA